MVRGLIALVIAFVITISGFAKPAYAGSINSNYLANSYAVVNTPEDINSIDIIDSFNSSDIYTTHAPNSFIDGLINGALSTLGVAIGGAIVCYTLDGVATVFFPPAGALSAFCPAVGGAFGSGNVVTQGVKVVSNGI